MLCYCGAFECVCAYLICWHWPLDCVDDERLFLWWRGWTTNSELEMGIGIGAFAFIPSVSIIFIYIHVCMKFEGLLLIYLPFEQIKQWEWLRESNRAVPNSFLIRKSIFIDFVQSIVYDSRGNFLPNGYMATAPNVIEKSSHFNQLFPN